MSYEERVEGKAHDGFPGEAWCVRADDAKRIAREADAEIAALRARAQAAEADCAALREAVRDIENWKRPMDANIEPALAKLNAEMRTCPECIAMRDHPVSRGVCAGGEFRHYEKLHSLLERRNAILDDTTPWPIIQMCRDARDQPHPGQALLDRLAEADAKLAGAKKALEEIAALSDARTSAFVAMWDADTIARAALAAMTPGATITREDA